ncbi:MAG: extradiol dioxygenase [Alphaproteobacteria bacterium BRH_c36]|nr:MAG: extradiol dioxygenase [Alphaproteobacteria bacterium BRH_c36]
MKKAHAVGINHVALIVGDIDEALAFYGKLFEFKLRGRSDGAAFIDLGDQFVALMKHRDATAPPRQQHFGLAVSDKALVRQALSACDIEVLDNRFLDFLDPWGNRIQVVDYSEIQFLKAPQVLAYMDLDDLDKSPEARQELLEKGIAVPHTEEKPDRSY